MVRITLLKIRHSFQETNFWLADNIFSEPLTDFMSSLHPLLVCSNNFP